MELRIWLENADPPTGWIVFGAGRPDGRSAEEDARWQLWFSGWLGLLQALDDVLDRSGASAAGGPQY